MTDGPIGPIGPGGPPRTPASSGPAARAPSAWQRTPLWLRLITALLLLTALALTVTGVFGARILRNYMVDRVDDQLRAAVAAMSLDDGLGERTPATQVLPSEFHMTLENADGTIVREFRAPLDDSPPPEVPNLTRAQASARSLEPFSVPAVHGKGDSWRAVAVAIEPVAICLQDCHRVTTVLVATSLDDVEATVHSLVRTDLIVGALVLAGLALAGYSVVRTAMRPLTEIERTAAAIAGGDLSRRIANEQPTTEVGRLGAALNSMLNQIESAFRARAQSESTARRSEERMRRFVADASHELRTPLTSIRGFAELHRQGAVTDPEEVSQLLARIEAEATRMGLLVDDLLLLARLDQQRPFDREPVDLVVVANDAVESARAVAPDRDVRLVTSPGTDTGGDDTDATDGAGVVVAGDEPRLRQVVTNLVDNAVAHTPEGSPVTVRLTRSERDGRGVAVLEVADEGPGLTRDQAERVFERFYRTDTARSRAQGGTGLGLSIVAAITAVHGGTVEVDTAPGEGTTFRVLLPLGP